MPKSRPKEFAKHNHPDLIDMVVDLISGLDESKLKDQDLIRTLANLTERELSEAELSEGLSISPGKIVADVRLRAKSLYNRWCTGEALPLLVLGWEEGSNYQPHQLSVAARAAAVVSVRNSLVESAHSSHGLSEVPIAVLTALSSLAWQREMDRGDLGMPDRGGRSPRFQLSARVDPFASLGSRYPAAWQALSQVASLIWWGAAEDQPETTPTEVEYAPVDARSVDLRQFALEAERSTGKAGLSRGYVIDGIAPYIATAMIDRLSEGVPLASNSLKHLSRNPEVVLAMVEYQLAAGHQVITPNIMLDRGWVAIRRRPLHPGKGIWSAPTVTEDLVPRHADAVKQAISVYT